MMMIMIAMLQLLFPRPYINDQVLDIEHTAIVDKALAEFDSRKKLGGEEFSLKYRDQLLTEIEESYQHYKAHNDSKNIFKAANTPITISVMWMVLYIFSQVRSPTKPCHVVTVALPSAGLLVVDALPSRQSCQLADVGPDTPGSHLGLC